MIKNAKADATMKSQMTQKDSSTDSSLFNVCMTEIFLTALKNGIGIRAVTDGPRDPITVKTTRVPAAAGRPG